MGPEVFADFKNQYDLLEQSHTGLQRDLIPRWMAEGCSDLGHRIDSSAYGESPHSLVERAFKQVELGPEDRFLDLGCGAGNILLLAGQFTHEVFGLERNPRLCRAGRTLFASLDLDPQRLVEADFLSAEWPDPTVVYLASARFGAHTLQALARRIDKSKIRAVVSLGSEPPLEPSRWRVLETSVHLIEWNLGEALLEESMTIYQRRGLVRESQTG